MSMGKKSSPAPAPAPQTLPTTLSQTPPEAGQISRTAVVAGARAGENASPQLLAADGVNTMDSEEARRARLIG